MLLGLKPDLNCIRGRSTRDCMDKIRLGDADMIALDAADVFVAGKYVKYLYLETLSLNSNHKIRPHLDSQIQKYDIYFPFAGTMGWYRLQQKIIQATKLEPIMLWQ